MRKNQEWLDSLKVGDRVAMDIGVYGSTQYVVATITKITPTRRMTTSNNKTFNADGTQYGQGSSYSGRVQLEPPTPEILERILRSRLIKALKAFKFEELTTEQLRTIQSIIKKEKEA